MAANPIFIDFEASSLTGWPIEVGWAQRVAGRIEEFGDLIKPDPDWDRTEWDECAEAIHGILLSDLERSGSPAREVAARLASVLAGRFVVSDAASFDKAFLDRLFDLLPDPPDIHITDIMAIARDLPDAAAETLRTSIAEHLPVHRAARDAADLAKAWHSAVDFI